MLGTVVAPALRSFEWLSLGCPVDQLEALARARWPSLERFTLWVDAREPRVGAALEAMLASLPVGVTELGLCNGTTDGNVLAVLAASPLASRLQRLELSKGTLDDEGARALFALRHRFPRLSALDVSENFVSANGLRELGQWVPTTGLNQRDSADTGGVRAAAILT
jgi:hypothetical protein